MGKVGFDFGFRRTVLVMLVAVVWVLSLTSPYPGFAAHLPESCSFGGSLDVTRGAKGIGVASVDGEITATGRCDTSFDGTREEGADAELSAVYSTNDLSCGYQTELPATLRVGAHTTSIAIQPFKGGTVRVTAGASNASGELTAPNACEEGSSSIELGFSQPIPVDPSLATAALFGSIPVLPPIVAPQSEPVGSTARPTAQSPVFQSRFGRGGSEFFTGSETDSVRTAVSSRHLFVSSEAADSVYSFDADAPSTPLYSKSVSNPLGVTEYRDEVFVVSGSNFGRIYVYRESDLTTLRTISPRFADPVGQPSSEIKDVLAEQMTDIDAAWGELWISLRDGGTMVLDPQTGTVKSVHFGDPIPIHVEESDAGGATKAVTYLEMCLDWPGNDCEPPADAVAKQNGAGYWIWINPPRITTDWAAGETGQASDSLSEAWNDVSAVPEHNGVVQGAQFLTRSLLPD